MIWDGIWWYCLLLSTSSFLSQCLCDLPCNWLIANSTGAGGNNYEKSSLLLALCEVPDEANKKKKYRGALLPERFHLYQRS
jgi:hypothetical protein